MALEIAEGFDALGFRTDLTHVDSDRYFHAQKPYRNGVVVYTESHWNGNGFGNSHAKVAVRDGEVVGAYEREMNHHAARVLGMAGTIYADTAHSGSGEHRYTYTTKTALSKWIAAVKAL